MLIQRFRAAVVSGSALMLLLASSCSLAQQPMPVRPKITGISHVGYFVSDLPKAIAFWHDFLGYDVAYTLPRSDTRDVRIAFIKINDHQHVELFNEPPPHPPNMMSHLCFSVDDIEAMRAYLRSKGFDVKPGDGGKTRAGDYAFEIKDPDETLVEFVQMLPTGMEAKAAGRFEPDTRISTKIYHLGFLVGNSVKAMDFYGNILGFKETWRGGADPKQLSWINMRVPDGNDYVEFMLYANAPSNFGTRNHIALAVPDIEKSEEMLRSRPAFKDYGKELKIAVGVNQKKQMNLYDPDGTRVELMEEHTVTGKPTPPSTAPPPPPAHD
jgi:catechol 2,3-dioxygenase-like lactoylglutathione lyase family enzyme